MIMAINILKAPHVGVRELKEKLSAFLKGDKPLVVTDHGAPTNVILPYDDVLELLDILDELNDSETRDIPFSIRAAPRIFETFRRASAPNHQRPPRPRRGK